MFIVPSGVSDMSSWRLAAYVRCLAELVIIKIFLIIIMILILASPLSEDKKQSECKDIV